MKRILCLWIRRPTAPGAWGARPGSEGRPAGRPGQSSPPRPTTRNDLEALAAWCQRYSPIVGLEDGPHPECLFLDLTGLEHLFSSETALVQEILDELRRRGFSTSAALADTVGAAWAVARFGAPGWLRQGAHRATKASMAVSAPTMHREAGGCPTIGGPQPPGSPCSHPTDARTHGPREDGLVILAPGEVWSALRPLPVEALRLPEATIQTCHQLGITRIGQLERLPRGELAARFGACLLERLDQATGHCPELIPAWHPPLHLEVQQELEPPTADQEILASVLESLIGQVSQWLVRHGRGVIRLVVALECPPCPPAELVIGLFQPTARARHLSDLARLQLERLRLAAPVAKVRVRPAITALLGSRQASLLGDDGPGSGGRRPWVALVDRLSSRLGARAVVHARLLPEAQPELACCWEPLVDVPGGRRRSRGCEPLWQPEALPSRPLRLLATPIPVTVIATVPDGPPGRLRWQGQQQSIARRWGPERIQTGWWRGLPIGRDYYRVETTTGHRLWIFRSLETGRWFLHGRFE